MSNGLEKMELEDVAEAKRLLVEKRLRDFAAKPQNLITPRTGEAPLPISVEQHGIWLHTAMEPSLPIYNESFTVHRFGSFDPAVLEAAFNEVLRRHEIWRTSFVMQGDEITQQVQPQLKVSIPLVDLSTVPEEKQDAEARRLATENAVFPIDITKAPLFRVRVLRFSPSHHQLQLTVHHIVCDGGSIHRIFAPELSAIYEAYAAGRTSPLQNPTLQYGDYTLWRERQLRAPETTTQLNYWRDQLSGELPILRLPTDHPRPARTSHRGAVEYIALPTDLMSPLRVMAGTHSASMYMVLLTGLKILFFRYGGQEDVLVGSVADGRRRPELEHVMGYFLDTLAIRTHPSAGLTGSKYLGQVRDTVLEALDAAQVPFSQVVKMVKRLHDRSHEAVFQTFFSYQQASRFAEGWNVTKTKIDSGATKFDIYVEVDERPDETTAQFTYNKDLFDAATIQRMAAHWLVLLNALANDPERSLGSMPLLTAEERTLMLGAWNQNHVPQAETPVWKMVEAVAARTSDALAIEYEDRTLTYAELVRRCDDLAANLRQAGARKGEIIAIYLDRSHDLPAAFLATMKTGAAYLPLDPAIPRDRLMLCLKDAQPAVILTQRSRVADLSSIDTPVLILEEIVPAEALTALTSVDFSLDDAAYVIHTSGSLGRPKAVEVSHRALLNLLTSMKAEPGFAADDILLAVTTISFDIACLELLLPLISGGRVVIASRSVAMDPYLLAAAIQESSCTVMQATPATWRGLLATGWRGRDKMRLFCGGEPLTRDLADGLLATGCELWNLYGPTETTIWSTVERITSNSSSISVGRPIANTTTYILDERQEPVPIGVPGELYIGGLGLSNGYLGQPLLTAEKYVTPAVAEGSRLYRTGDSATYRPDGKILIQGRSDNQVKVRGYRVELEEIDAYLVRHPKVSSAVSKVWPDSSGENRLCAYLVGEGPEPLDATEMRQFLATHLPDYMMPSLFVAVDSLPLTANGKVDRKALPKPDAQALGSLSRSPRDSYPPCTEQERRLAAIWQELLGVSSVSLDDNFFDLGGHSLQVARLQHRIASEFKKEVSMAAVFHAPTIRQQVLLLNESLGLADSAQIIPIQPHGSATPLFWIEPSPLIHNLAKALGEDQPFFGVTMTLNDLDQFGPKPTMEDFAQFYAENILKIQPAGPFYLGGFCTGGVLAYAIATYLQLANHDVASLVLLDAENPAFYQRLGSLTTEIRKLRFYARRALEKKSVNELSRRFKFRIRRLLRLQQPVLTEMSVINNAIAEAAFNYAPPAYHSNVLLLLSEDRPAGVNHYSGWRVPIRGKLICVEVSGHHEELLTNGYAQGIADVLQGTQSNSIDGVSWLSTGPPAGQGGSNGTPTRH
jgi:amino acid adenylation domain-containing protein